MAENPQLAVPTQDSLTTNGHLMGKRPAISFARNVERFSKTHPPGLAPAVCDTPPVRTYGDCAMSSDRRILPRFTIRLVLLIVCFTISACAAVEPTVDTSTNQRAESEAIANELRASAEGGDAAAQNKLGLLYYEGTGVPQNYLQANHWFEEAAKQGHTGDHRHPMERIIAGIQILNIGTRDIALEHVQFKCDRASS